MSLQQDLEGAERLRPGPAPRASIARSKPNSPMVGIWRATSAFADIAFFMAQLFGERLGAPLDAINAQIAGMARAAERAPAHFVPSSSRWRSFSLRTDGRPGISRRPLSRRRRYCREPRAVRIISNRIASPASTSCSRLTRGRLAALALRDGAARHQRHMDESRQRRLCGRRLRPRSRASTDSCRDSVRRRARILPERRSAAPRASRRCVCGPNVSASLPWRDLAEPDAGAFRVRPDRGDGVARPRLDPHMRRACGKPEHQQHVGLLLGRAAAAGRGRHRHS